MSIDTSARPGGGVAFGGGQQRRVVVPRDLAPVPEVPWPRVCAAMGCVAGLLVLVPFVVGGHRMWWLYAVALMAVTGLVGYSGWRTNQRRHLERAARLGLMQELSSPAVKLQATWSRSWRVGIPTRVVVTHSPLEQIEPGRVANVVSQAFVPGVYEPAPASRWAKMRRPVPGRIVLIATTASETPAKPAEVTRAKEVTEQLFKNRGRITSTSVDDDGTLTSFTVSHNVGVTLVEDQARDLVTRRISACVPGRWTSTFNMDNDTIVFERRPPLPEYALRPVLPIDPGDTRIPMGIDEYGETQWWVFAGQFAHMLLAGRTRTGKTVSLTGTMMEFSRRGHRVFGIDPKRTEFLAMRTWPNVQFIATRVPDQVALVWQMRELMNERYRRIEEDGASEDDFEHILLVIDEYRQFYGNVRSWWASIKVTGMPAQCPVTDWIGDLLRMAAAARIHILLGTQRPDADVLGGEALAIDTPILTTRGWTTMGQIGVGEHVFGPAGEPIEVTATTPIVHDRPCYRVEFSDGSTIVADANHLWQVSTTIQRGYQLHVKPRAQRWPEHAPLLAAVDEVLQDRDRLQQMDAVTVSDFEQLLTGIPGARIPLLRRGLHDGRLGVQPVDTRPREQGRFPARRFHPLELAEALHTELSRPTAPTATRHAVFTTAQLAERLTAQPDVGFAIPATQPLQQPDQHLPIDPWLLGYWLGDGHKATAAIATNDPEVLDRIHTLGYRTPHHGRYNYGVVLGSRGQHHPGNLKTQLRALNLIHNKHVPEPYLHASIPQRQALLAGLLDADGTITVRTGGRSAQVAFTNTNRDLINAVAHLAASLGMIPTTTQIRDAGTETHPSSVAHGRRLRPAWAVRFTPNQQVFAITRKQDRLATALPHIPTTRHRYITRITPTDPVPVRCISVNSPDHLYLAGHTLIATHNCRDNFSARGATGGLSPDGAQMMFPNRPQIATSIPLTVRGRGTYAGEDDTPREIQYFFTPNPRTAKDPEHLQVLDQLRPATTTWDRLTITYPPTEALMDEISEHKLKTHPDWLAIQRATLTPLTHKPANHPGDEDTDDLEDPTELDDITEQDGTDEPTGAFLSNDTPNDTPNDLDGLDDAFHPATTIRPSHLAIGDLMDLDGEWVTIVDIDTEDDQVLISWSTSNEDGNLVTPDTQPVRARRPVDEPGE